jgi:hypothetical protein
MYEYVQSKTILYLINSSVLVQVTNGTVASFLQTFLIRNNGGCGVSADEYSCAYRAQTNFGDLTPYLTI